MWGPGGGACVCVCVRVREVGGEPKERKDDQAACREVLRRGSGA